MTLSATPDPPLKASDVIATELRERILAGEFAEGTSLPPERELVTRHGISRTTVREALRILEAQGFVHIKTGRAGGAFVRKPSEAAVESSVTMVIRGQQIKLIDLLETRESLEPQCARWAAKYRTAGDLAALDAADEQMARRTCMDEFLSSSSNWHVAVAVATHNELLTGFMIALSRGILAATIAGGFVDDEVARNSADAHLAITRAIREGDAEAAERRMFRHVNSYKLLALEVEGQTAIELD